MDPKYDFKALKKRLNDVIEEREGLAILIRIAREEKWLAKDRAEYERLQDPDEPAYPDRGECCCAERLHF